MTQRTLATLTRVMSTKVPQPHSPSLSDMEADEVMCLPSTNVPALPGSNDNKSKVKEVKMSRYLPPDSRDAFIGPLRSSLPVSFFCPHGDPSVS